MSPMAVPSLGRRGEGWVALQFVALAAILLTGWMGPSWQSSWARALLVLGVVLVAAGGALAVAGVRGLGSSLTPWPHPVHDATLREDGVYARARHPIYGALLLLGLGFTALTSWWAFLPWAVLLAILLAKSVREEAWLTDRYERYAAYRVRVRKRFVPFVA